METITKSDLAVVGIDRRAFAKAMKMSYQTLSNKMSMFSPWKDAELERGRAILKRRIDALDRANGKQEAR